MTGPVLPPVVIPTGCDPNIVVGHLVDEAVLVCDAPGPVTGKIMFQRLRLADAFIPVADDVAEEQVDPLDYLAVLRLPPEVVLPRIGIPDDAHGRAPSVSVDQIVLFALVCLETLHGI